MGTTKVVVTWFILLVAVVVMSNSSCSGEPESKWACIKQCITNCVDKRGNVCAYDCCIECKWPFSEDGEIATEIKNFEEQAMQKAAHGLHK